MGRVLLGQKNLQLNPLFFKRKFGIFKNNSYLCMNKYLLVWKNFSTKEIVRETLALSREEVELYFKMLLDKSELPLKLIDIKLVEIIKL